MSIELIARLIGMAVLGSGGFYLGVVLGNMADGRPELWAGVFTLMGILTGLVVTPYISTRPIRALRRRVGQLSAQTMIAGMASMNMPTSKNADAIMNPVAIEPAPQAAITSTSACGMRK